MSSDADSNLPPELRSALDPDASGAEEPPSWGRVWELLDHAAPPDEALPDAEDTWAGVRAHLEETSASNPDRRPRNRRPARRASRRRRRWGWGTAATAALLLVLAVWWWTSPVEVTAPPGTTVTHTMPDGSTVELNGDTRLTYPRTLSSVALLESDRRTVQLRGEAYFEVEDGDRPFLVETPAMHVEVVSTRFSVRSRPGEDDEAHVALAEGRLRVARSAASERTLPLRPGQVATTSPRGTRPTVRDTSIDRVTAWRRGGFAATARPLPAVARALERRFGPSVRLDASINSETRSTPLTLYYSRNVDLESILHDICMARGLTYRATASGYVLSPADGNDAQSPRSP